VFVYDLRPSSTCEFCGWLQKVWHTDVITCVGEGVQNMSEVVLKAFIAILVYQSYGRTLCLHFQFWVSKSIHRPLFKQYVFSPNSDCGISTADTETRNYIC
jgi:hypothetical protein